MNLLLRFSSSEVKLFLKSSSLDVTLPPLGLQWLLYSLPLSVHTSVSAITWGVWGGQESRIRLYLWSLLQDLYPQGPQEIVDK